MKRLRMAPAPNDPLVPAWGDEVLRLPTGRARATTPIDRPTPPACCAEDERETFVPAPDFAAWLNDTFVAGTGALANASLEHLLDAEIGVLWTNAVNVAKQREVMGTAEIPNAMAGGWKRARFEFQLREWFGAVPDFVLTFSAPRCEELSDRAFCALCLHELLHCGQQQDRYGAPMFGKDGRPIFAVRGHDVEEFVEVVSQFGIVSQDVRDLVNAANRAPVVSDERIEIACGTCIAKAA